MKSTTRKSGTCIASPQPAAEPAYLPFRLTMLNERFLRRIAQERPDLSVPEWRTLALLGQSGAMSANRVIKETRMNKVQVSRIVTKLLRARYITRKPDPIDRRCVILALTAEGMKVYRRILIAVGEWEAEILTVLSGAERAGFKNALIKIEAHLGNERPPVIAITS